MHPAIPHLLEVQRLDLRIAAFRANLEAFPRRLRDAENLLSGARKELAAARDAHTASLKQRKILELDAEQWKDRARKFNDQSSAVKTNEAYNALRHEIANAEAEIAKAEDRVLEGMMAAEEIDRRIHAAEAALREVEKSMEAEKKTIQAEMAAGKAELAAALAEREAAIAPVPEGLRDRYTRIARRHNGVALAEARNEQCLGCGMRVLPHIFAELRRAGDEAVFQCETCGRLLYFVEPPPAPAPPPAQSAAKSAP